MPRKKSKPPVDAATELQSTSIAIAEPPAPTAAQGPSADADAATPPTDGTGKNYGPPYKSIFTSAEQGFELGEDRRFKQRVFSFKEKPGPEIIAVLKDNGFTYRAAEKSWTIPATAESRVITDRLAKQFAGGEASLGRG